MKSLYICYSHHCHVEFVQKVVDDLKLISDGDIQFKVWFDDSKKAGQGIAIAQDFAVAMKEGIDNCDYLIYFMSNASVNDQSVCIDEITWAKKIGKPIIPILLDKDAASFHVHRLSYISALNCLNEKQEINEEVYKKLLGTLVEAITNYEEVIQKDNGEKSLLNKLYRSEPQFSRDKNFIGRKWLYDICVNWLNDKTRQSKIFSIIGGAGSGKSSFVSHFLLNHPNTATHFCAYMNGSTRKRIDVLCNLSYYLCQINSSYKASIINQDIINDSKLSGEIFDVFDMLFTKPLKSICGNFCFVIDSIDEMDQSEAKSLLSFLNDISGKLPSNISFIITSRPERKVLGNYKEYDYVELDGSDNIKDAKEYISSKLKYFKYEDEKLGEKLLEASEANFLYLDYWFKQCETFGFDPNVPLPKGLSSRLQDFIQRKFDTQNSLQIYSDNLVPILRVLCATHEPTSIENLQLLTSQSMTSLNQNISLLGFMLKNVENKYSLYHKSLKEHLIDANKSEDFFIDEVEAHMCFLECYINRLNDISKAKSNAYFTKYLILHLSEVVTNSLYSDSLKSLGIVLNSYLLKEYEYVNNLFAQYFLNINSQEEFIRVKPFLESISNEDSFKRNIFNVIASHRNFDSCEKFTDNYFPKGSLSSILCLGNLHFFKMELSKASEYFNEALNIVTKNVSTSDDRNLRVDHAYLYNRLGNIAYKKDDFNLAKNLFQRNLEINKENILLDPCYENQYWLSVSYGRLADIASRQDDLEAARKYWIEVLKITEEAWHKNPSFDSVRNLSIAYYKYGKLLLKYDEIEAAKALFIKSLDINTSNWKQMHNYDSEKALVNVYIQLADSVLRQDDIKQSKDYYLKAYDLIMLNKERFIGSDVSENFAVINLGLGNIAMKQGELNLAKEYFKKNLDICKSLNEINNEYTSKTNLSIAYGRLGSLAFVQNELEDAKKYFQTVSELTKYNAGKKPSYESRRHLSITYSRLGDIEFKRGEITIAEELFLKALEIDYDNLNHGTNKYQASRSLANTYTKLARTEIELRKYDKAEVNLHKGLEINEKEYESFKGYEPSIGLSNNYFWLAKLSLLKNDLENASKYFKMIIEVLEHKQAEFDTNDIKCLLHSTYSQLKNIAKTQNNEEWVDIYFDKESKLENEIKSQNSFEVF